MICILVCVSSLKSRLTSKGEHIMLTCPCNVDPLTPHFYIVKLGFTWIYIIFALKHRLWVLVKTASMKMFLDVPTIYVLSKNKKTIHF